MMGWMAPLRHLSAKLLSDRISSEWEPSMGEVTTIGLDLAKLVFQAHGVDAEGATVLRKQLRRAQVLEFFSRLPPCLVGLEACATAISTMPPRSVASSGKLDVTGLLTRGSQQV